MQLFLQILGIIFLIILAVLGLYFFVFMRALRRIKKGSQINSVYGGIDGMEIPARIELIRVSEPEWTNPVHIESLFNEITRQGFKPLGTYIAPNAPSSEQYQFLLHPILGGTLAGFVSDKDGLTVVLHEHPSFGIWAETFWKYTSGKLFTASNAKHTEHLDAPPKHPKIFLKEASVFKLIVSIRNQRKAEPYETVTQDSFPKLIQSFYAEEMDWRNTRGYLTETELQRLATAADIQLSRQDLELAHLLALESANEGLSEACRDTFIKTTTLSVAEWETIREQLVIIHERMSAGEAANFLEQSIWACENIEDDTLENEIEALEELDVETTAIRQAFADINIKLPHEVQFKKLGEVNKPVGADIYLSPPEIL